MASKASVTLVDYVGGSIEIRSSHTTHHANTTQIRIARRRPKRDRMRVEYHVRHGHRTSMAPPSHAYTRYASHQTRAIMECSSSLHGTHPTIALRALLIRRGAAASLAARSAKRQTWQRRRSLAELKPGAYLGSAWRLCRL